MRLPRKPSTSEVSRLFRAAGFDVLTPLQRKLIPIVVSGRDAAVFTDVGPAKAASYLVPLLARFRGERVGPRVLILVAEPREVQDITQAYQRIAKAVTAAPELAGVGDAEDARREERRLEKTPVIVVGTVQRVIDHIRRGSLSFENLVSAVVEHPAGPAAEDFTRDVQFIFTKLPGRRQILLFGTANDAEAARQGIASLLRRPVMVTPEIPARAVAHGWYAADGQDKSDLLLAVLSSRSAFSVAVLHAPRTNGDALARRLSQAGYNAQALSTAAGPVVRRKMCQAFQQREVEILCASYPPPPDLDVTRADLVVYYDLPRAMPTHAGTQPVRGSVVALAEESQSKELAKIEELHGIIMRKESRPSDVESVKGSLERIVRRIREQENLEELVRLRSLVRRFVPFFMRSYVLAFLLKSGLPRLEPEIPAGQPATPARPRPEQNRRGEKGGRGALPGLRGIVAQKGTAPAEAQKVSDRGFIQLFLSIGRNRRVYPRDLTSLFVEKLGFRPDEIGRVRIFDKYSFVEVPRSRAEDAIKKLTGVEFKGRALTVNFAKKKEEKEAL